MASCAASAGNGKAPLAHNRQGINLPIGIIVSGANRHDIKLLEGTLQSIIIARPEGSNLCLDAGYAGAQSQIEAMGYAGYIRGRGEERQGKERDANFKARRRVVEACHSWLNRFRKLMVQYEKKEGNYLALLYFACAIIVWRQIIPVHPGLIPG
ncbi:MAG: transposase [Treponema sp.]|jgi:putative transposase|nr:transposase [Treponema sp.]